MADIEENIKEVENEIYKNSKKVAENLNYSQDKEKDVAPEIIQDENKDTIAENTQNKETSIMSDSEVMKKYGIDIEYTNDYNTLNKLHNCMIVENESYNDKIDFINSILKYNSPEQLGLVLIDINNVNLNFYKELPHMIIPVITDNKTVVGVLEWTLAIINFRLNAFAKVNVKDINTYNRQVTNEKMPINIIVIDEIYEINRDKENKKRILRILMNGERAGIKCIFYSKFRKKNLNIGSMEDLMEIYTKYSPNIFLDISNKKIDSVSKIDNMSGFNFEQYVGELLYKNGFEKIEVTQRSGDFGVDVIAYKDDIKYAIQCKKYSSPVGIKAVQEVIASKAMHNCHVAVVLTNNYFTKNAEELAERNNVLLWNREKLVSLISKIAEKE